MARLPRPLFRTLCCLANVISPLLVGGFVYLAWRSQSLLMFSWVDAVGLDSLLHPLREFAAPMLPHVPKWVLFSLPDAAWVYSMTAAYVLVWRRAKSAAGLFWVSLGCLLGAGAELGQLVSLVPGTFDLTDLCLIAAAAPLAYLTTRRFL